MLEQYQIEQQISCKAGRKTYRAKNIQSDRQVVIKILEFNNLFSWDDFKLFEREAKILQNLDNPYIPEYLGYFEINGSNCQGVALVQTYIDAPSLAELIQQGIKFSEAEIIELANKLLDLLNYLHKLNPPVIHRDIKPSNILLTNRSGNSIGDVYLVDFGSVQTVAKKEAGTITIVGSYGYIPLEQFMGQTTFASDLYSLGMTLIYLVSGIHPADLTQSSGKVKFDKSNISRGFARWLSTITEPYMDRRYPSVEAASTALHFEQSSYQNSLLSLDRQAGSLMLHISPDRQTLEIVYKFSYTYLSCWLGLVILLPAFILPPLAWGFVIALFASLFGNFILRQKPKYRIILLNKYKQMKEGFYEQDRRNLHWKNSSPLHIHRLIYSPSYTFDKCLNARKEIIPGGKVAIGAKLSIASRYEEICINELKNKAIAITDDDLWRLGNEISNFLDLELEVIAQTPVIPNQITA